MIVELVRPSVKELNQFPALGRVSDTISRLAITTGMGNPCYQQLHIIFGAYAMVFEDNNPTNTTKARTTGAIPLAHIGNWQGDYTLMSLVTGKSLAQHK